MVKLGFVISRPMSFAKALISVSIANARATTTAGNKSDNKLRAIAKLYFNDFIC
jgi:hypothetical protein